MSDLMKVEAAGGVVFREDASIDGAKVILIFRRGVWDLPKGKLEKGESIEDCAVREVAEEIGLSKCPTIVSSLADTYHEYVQGGIRYGKTTYWYAMEISDLNKQDFNPQSEEGIEKVAWTPLNKAFELVGYKNLSTVLNSFDRWHQTNKV